MKQRTLDCIDSFFKDNEVLNYLKEDILKSIDMLIESAKNGKILVCGNGGSASDSEHIAGELLKSFVLKRKVSGELKNKLINQFGEDGELIADNIQGGIKCIPLTSFCALNTAFLNDCNEKMLFAQQVNALGDEGDTLIAISTSGNAKNVCYATQLAKVKGLKVVALTGENGGKLRSLADVTIGVPSSQTYRVQEYHIQVYHLLCMVIESELFDE